MKDGGKVKDDDDREGKEKGEIRGEDEENEGKDKR
jgi:hypothetical protein